MYLRLTLVVVLTIAVSGCSTWLPYRHHLELETTKTRSEPFVDQGECVVAVETVTTDVYRERHRFRTGADLYGGAAFLAIGWLFIIASLTFEPPEDASSEEEWRRGALTAGLVNAAVSLPMWGYFLVKRLNRPARSQEVFEEVRTTEELERAEGRCPGHTPPRH